VLTICAGVHHCMDTHTAQRGVASVTDVCRRLPDNVLRPRLACSVGYMSVSPQSAHLLQTPAISVPGRLRLIVIFTDGVSEEGYKFGGVCPPVCFHANFSTVQPPNVSR